jgi:plastocyanin
MVIHADDNGAPGPVLGQSAVSDGLNVNVAVELSQDAAPGTRLHAMLHTDAGVAGTYEFPGDDTPVRVGDQVVMLPFQVIDAMSSMDGSGDMGASVSIMDGSFSGDPLTISAGTTVVWTNEGSNPHTVTADDGSFDSGNLSNGDTFSFTFTTPGEYPYYCAYHGGPGGSGMSGTIIVTP